jgi:hypothetical protein
MGVADMAGKNEFRTFNTVDAQGGVFWWILAALFPNTINIEWLVS